LEHIMRAQRRDSSLVQTYRVLGDLYKSLGLTHEATEQYETALAMKLHSADVHFNLGSLYGPMGKLDKAIENLEAAVRLKPSSAEAHQTNS